VDVVLTDLAIPGMSGRDGAATCRQWVPPLTRLFAACQGFAKEG
jgi:CheY-like chemotaxis protein